MRLKITLESDQPIVLPKYYQHILQAVIYDLINDDETKKFLHNIGFQWEKRTFKPLTYSWLQGRYRVSRGIIEFTSPVFFYLSSPWEPLIQWLLDGVFQRKTFQFGKNQVSISDVEMLPEPVFKEKTKIRTLSPVTMYSTLLTEDGKKVTHYYDVQESRFSELIRKNLIKKALAFYKQDLSDAPFSIQLGERKRRIQQHTIRYKSLVFKGWMGTFYMSGDQRLQKIAYDMGLGGKNGIGFGFIDVLED